MSLIDFSCTRHAAVGMLKWLRFRWVACQIDALKACLDYPRLRKTLRNLPRTLDKTYTRVLESLPREYSAQAATILNLLIWSGRKFELNELVDAVATDLDENPAFDPKNRMPVQRDILKLCSSLVAVSRIRVGFEREVVQLAHFSVREYLLSDHVPNAFKSSIGQKVSQSYLARLCLRYLIGISHLTFQNRPVSLLDPRVIKEEFPFVNYSARYWMDHAREVENEDESLSESALDFFLEEQTAFSVFEDLFDDLQTGEDPDPLWYAATGGLKRTIINLLDRGADINASNGAALQTALNHGRDTTAQMLLDRGANVYTEDHKMLTAAMHKCHHTTIQLILDSYADKDTALTIAVFGRSNTTVQLLLDRGADVNTRNGMCLRFASLRGYYTIVQLLLNGGAHIDARDSVALLAASSKSHYSIVQLSLDHGADVNARDGEALREASKRGDDTTVQLLLDGGANPNACRQSQFTALQEALKSGYENLARSLSSQIDRRETVVESTLVEPYYKIARLLVDRGANIDIPGGQWFDTLRVDGWNVEVVQRILGSDPCLSSDHFVSALCDISPQSEAIVAVMLPYLTKEIALQEDCWWSRNLLHCASFFRSESIAQRCLDLGVDVNAEDKYGRIALHYAGSLGNLAIVKMLVQAGSKVEARDDLMLTPLSCARIGMEDPWIPSRFRDRERQTPNLDVIEYLSKAKENTRYEYWTVVYLLCIPYKRAPRVRLPSGRWTRRTAYVSCRIRWDAKPGASIHAYMTIRK